MATDKRIRQAMQAGREQAADAVQRRSAVLARQRRRGAAPLPGSRDVAPPRIQPRFFDAVSRAAPEDLLVAEGDSWFDYPFFDVLKLLEDEHGYDVRHVAHMGDRVEDMAYGGGEGAGQLDALTRLLEKLLRERKVPRAILLSGGGNDIAGNEFFMLLEHRRSAASGLNAQVVSGIIDQRLRLSYVTILSAVTRLCELRTGKRIPIVFHGYDYPVADGRGYLGGWSLLPGPWLEPGFRQKGYTDTQERLELLRELMDRFNDMLASVAALPGFEHTVYVDLRGTLTTGAGYKKLWENELHPSRKGFQLVTEKVARAIGALPVL
jgi:lysophospholipase L1-like esterase